MRHLLFALFVLIAKPTNAQDMTALTGAARGQIGVTVIYDPAGDPPPERGVCTDVLIRAFCSGWVWICNGWFIPT